MLLSFSTLVLQSSTTFFIQESPMLSLSYTSGNFSLQNLACIFQQWASSSAIGLREQASWMHTHLVSFVDLSYIYSSSASIAWQSLLLTLTSIDGHLHSPLISCINVRLSPFCLLHTTSIIILCSTYSAMSMAHAHVLRENLKSLRLLKYETIAWLVIGVVHD